MSEHPTEGCAFVRDLTPELAMGVAAGDERAAALAHLVTCADCRARLDEATGLVDELLLLAPEHEPPPGFEGRVLAAMDTRTPTRRRPTVWLAAAAAVVVVALGSMTVTRWAGADADDRRLADEYRQALEVADGSSLRAADLLTPAGSPAGHVFAYEGKPSWLFMTVEGAPSGTYHVTLVTTDGRVRDIGDCWVREGRGSWGTALDVSIGTVDRVEMHAEDGGVLTSSFG
jgi:hypothetical protein